jgi:hypothetical protein
MPWQECNPMNERLKFAARLLRGEDGGAVPRVRRVAEDRLQDPRPLQRDRPRRAHRPLASTLSPRQSIALPDRDADRSAEARQAELGRAEDQGKARTALSGRACAGNQHNPCGSRPPRSGQAQNGAAEQGEGNAALSCPPAQRRMVRRLQGRVHARRSALLLPVCRIAKRRQVSSLRRVGGASSNIARRIDDHTPAIPALTARRSRPARRIPIPVETPGSGLAAAYKL